MYDETNHWNIIASGGASQIPAAIMMWCFDKAMLRFHPQYGFESIVNSAYLMAEMIADRNLVNNGIINAATGVLDKNKLPFPLANPTFATGQAPIP